MKVLRALGFSFGDPVELDAEDPGAESVPGSAEFRAASGHRGDG